MDGELPKHHLQILQEEKSTISSSNGSNNLTTANSISKSNHHQYTTTISEQLSGLSLSSQTDNSQGVIRETQNESSNVQDKPKSVIDYYTDSTPSKAFDYVVEVYGFHPSLKTKDIMKELHTYGSLKMRLKWVNDDHALAIYSNAKDAYIASKGLYVTIKVMLLSKSDNVESLIVAEKVAESMRDTLSETSFDLRPKVRRPQTTSSVARRMVGHALGIKINVPSEKDQQERLRIQTARDEKRNK